jgi:hypothetical protein
MPLPDRLARTLAFLGFLLSALGLLFPVFADFQGFNGLECALYFLNSVETAPYSVALALFFASSFAGLFTVLRGKSGPVFLSSACVVCTCGGLVLRLVYGLALSAYGWAAGSGLVFQAVGCIALVFLKLGSRTRRS